MYKALIILLFIYGCAYNREVDVPGKNVDSAYVSLTVIDKIKSSYDSLCKLKNINDTALQILALKYQQLLKESLQSQTNALKLIAITNNFMQLEKEKVVLLSRLNNANLYLAQVEKQKQRISDSLQAEKKHSKYITIEKNKLQATIDNASGISIVGVGIKAFGYRKPIFKGTAMPFETDKAAKVKQVVVSFIIPQNKLTGEKKLEFEVKIHGTAGMPEAKGLKENSTVTYNGKVQEISIPFNKKIDWRASDHLVEIFCNGALLSTGNLILK